MSDDSLDGCHCCEGLVMPGAIHNDAGLSTLSWRVDTYPGFNQRMLTRLPLWYPPDAQMPETAPRPLAALLTRDPQDPAVALMDAAGKPTRVGFRMDGETKVRFAKTTGDAI